ncbi:unnamed protein product [marine sediment metagenome]|uniref:Uncharacterized protein n=1 Tax=marine sediment metagenome TaxID=412755 RepID=X1NQ41_9ZZZZ
MEGFVIKIIPGCPSQIVGEDDEPLAPEVQEQVKAALADECGCVVPSQKAEAALAAIAEAEELAEEGSPEAEAKAQEAEALAEEALAEAPEEPVCSLEPNVPWKESVCGVVAEEAGRLAADRVFVRLREEGVIA